MFYDASGYFSDSATTNSLSAASAAVRSWYSDMVNNDGYTGQLYEIPLVNRSERPAVPNSFVSWPSFFKTLLKTALLNSLRIFIEAAADIRSIK